MTQITAALVKELRERTGSGMMECKKALQETSGDIEAAVEHLRTTGQAKAEKKAGRTTAEGIIALATAADAQAMAMVEVNCETDFVAKRDEFTGFAQAVADLVVAEKPTDLDGLMALPLPISGTGAESVEETRKNLVAKIGENINVRRFSLVTTATGVLNGYSHGGRIGVIVELGGGSAELAKDVAMHVAASSPLCISVDQIPAEIIDKERKIFVAQAAESGKPADIVEKMVEGKLRKFRAENTLLGQPFVKNPDQSVEKLLAESSASVDRFERFELGEGIEKKVEDFRAEVMAQARGD